MQDTKSQGTEEVSSKPVQTAVTTQKKSNKLLIIVAIIAFIMILLCIVSLVVVKLFVLPPSSKQVCTKVRDLMVEEYKNYVGDDKEAENTVQELFGNIDECVKEEEDSRKDKSWTEVRKYSRCIMDADKFADLEKCDAWNK
jgi:hypothetical protein